MSNKLGEPPRVYRISSLSEFKLSEDFRHSMEVAFCTLIIDTGRVYLSLDPYTEGSESKKDNFTFTGRDILVL